ncbi:MAG TPA: glycosyltransferase family 39 protein [Solirubrobacteraceae bacterium]|nr:glycosyltransferase family 39 protein [Solirubrobacteraceae bacterium]
MPFFQRILQPQPAGPTEADLPAGEGWLRERRLRFEELWVATRGLPEVALLMAVSGLLNFWDLSRNHWANAYYAAAVRSMAASWHNFLFASLDPAGVQTIDKTPLAFWIQALSVRLFGFHPLAILIPDALIGVATVVLLYDLVRRLFGRAAGLIAGLALAVTPITVAMSRHNNPDALLALCCVGALWALVRAVEDGRARWIVLAGAIVGLGFETKMALALVVAPGIAIAWLVARPGGWRGALDSLAAGAIAMVIVGGAWPLAVGLTPAADRPWISGTSDNSIVSLIFDYNGFGRVGGQVGGPVAGPGGASGIFGGSPGVLRLLNADLGGQAGWLLAFALAGALALAIATRLRRSDARTPGVIALGLALLVTGVIFSVAHGIFHPYYVSLLAPFAAGLTGAAAGQMLSGRVAPLLSALVLAAAGAGELVVLGDYSGELPWVVPLILAACALACLVLLAGGDPRARWPALSLALAALLVAPGVWAVDTLGYSTVGTFPAGGPARYNSAAVTTAINFAARGLGGGAPGGQGPPGGAPRSAGAPTGSSPVSSLFGGGQQPRSFGAGSQGRPGTIDDRGLRRIIAYVAAHGGGTLAVSSQSNAANAIVAQDANIAGLGGWSGRESDPSIAWLAQEVDDGRIRWIFNQQDGNFGAPADGRPGDTALLDAAAKVCSREVTSVGAKPWQGPTFADGVAAPGLYDCQGKGAALAALAAHG